MQIIRKKLSADEFQAPGVRYNPGTDTVQTLVGGTWVNTPAADPRTSASALLPPRTTGDIKCDAAANMTAKVKSIVDYYLATAEQALFVSGVLGIITLFFPLVGLIAEVLWGIADVLVGLGVVVVGGAMTSTVYDHLTCYFYDQLDSSGQLDQTGFDAVLSAVAAGESSTVYDVIAAVFSGLGWVGIDNAGATGSETGDCSACDVWCHEFDFTSGSQFGFAPVVAGGTDLAVWTGTGWTSIYNRDSGNITECRIFNSAWGVTADVTDIQGLISSGLEFTGWNIYTYSPTLVAVSSGVAGGHGDEIVGYAFDVQTSTGCRFDLGVVGNTTITISKIKVYGHGTNPFGADNCT